jgi:signal transduction histidine kinase
MNYQPSELPRPEYVVAQAGEAAEEAPSAIDPSASLPSDMEAERAAWFMRARFVPPGQQQPNPPAERRPWDARTVAATLQGDLRFSTITMGGERVRVLSVPLMRAGQVQGAVQVARPLGELDRLREGQLRTLLTLCPFALIIAGMGALLLTERALRPVREVTQAAAQISAEDLGRRLEVRGEDELAQLAHTFNGMIERLETSFEQQRRFTSDASHELRTPLARIKVTTSEALDGEHTDDEYRKALQIADRAADTMGRLVDQLLLLARGDGGQLRVRAEQVDVGYLLSDTAETFRAPGGPLVEARMPSPPIAVLGDPDWIACILKNLTENAVRHTPPGGLVGLTASAYSGWVALQVTDTGEGIAAEHLPRLTDRFYRVDAARSRNGKGSRGGTGLGLAITRMLVEAHQGRLDFQSEPGKGTRVTVLLPAAPIDARDSADLPALPPEHLNT